MPNETSLSSLWGVELVYLGSFARGCFCCGGEVWKGLERETGDEYFMCGSCGYVVPWSTPGINGETLHGFISRRQATQPAWQQLNGGKHDDAMPNVRQ